jgi:predicted small metal-binding protein
MQSQFTCAYPDLHICPIQSCQWYTSTNDPDEVKVIVRMHLVQIHETSHSMNAISDDTFALYDLHPCQTCNTRLVPINIFVKNFLTVVNFTIPVMLMPNGARSF